MRAVTDRQPAAPGVLQRHQERVAVSESAAPDGRVAYDDIELLYRTARFSLADAEDAVAVVVDVLRRSATLPAPDDEPLRLLLDVHHASRAMAGSGDRDPAGGRSLAVPGLDPPPFDCLVLAIVAHLSTHEIATVLDLSPEKVAARLRTELLSLKGVTSTP